MPQVSLYVDQETLEKIEELARKSHTSISKWVGNNIRRIIQDDYPEDFFELFGAVRDDSFKRPDQPSSNQDAKRVKI